MGIHAGQPLVCNVQWTAKKGGELNSFGACNILPAQAYFQTKKVHVCNMARCSPTELKGIAINNMKV
jgi:hypothetical protein